MIYYFKLIRPVNIFVIALTLLLFRYCIVDVESYATYDFAPYLHTIPFYILLFTTLFISASGYVINDIFDVDADQINRPNSVIIGKHLDENKAFTFYMILTSLGIIGTFALIFTTHQIKISMIPLIVSVLLYLYASTFKKMLLIGNIVISICAALPVIFIALYELRINDFDTAVVILFTQGIGLAALVYGTFAFLTTLIREIIKDVEDMEGDDMIDAQTFPIVLGIRNTKILIVSVQIITLGLLGLLVYYTLAYKLRVIFYGVFILLIVPILIQIVFVILAKKPEQFKWASWAGKVHMILGVLTLLFFLNGTAPHFFNQLFNFISQVIGFIPDAYP